MRKILFIPMLLLLLVAIVGCTNGKNMTLEELQTLADEYEVIAEVSDNFELPAVDGVVITWTSNNSAITIEDGLATVTRGTSDVTVTLTATFTAGDNEVIKTFTVVVKALGSGIFDAAINSANPGSSQSDHFQIVTKIGDINISWVSDNSIVVIDNSLGFAFVTPAANDTIVSLTATFTKGSDTTTHIYLVTIIGSENSGVEMNVAITFNVTLDEGLFADDIYIVGPFNDWDPGDINYKLFKDGNSWSATFFFNVFEGDTFEYKYYSNKWEILDSGPMDNRSFIISTLETYSTNDTVTAWEFVGGYEVNVTFTVNVPSYTPIDDDLYLIGNFGEFGHFPNWIPVESELTDLIKLERVGDVATVTLTLYVDEDPNLEYKVSRGTYQAIEGNEAGAHLPNRVTKLNEGLTNVVVDVLTWEDVEDPGLIVDDYEVVLTFNVNLPSNTPENANIYVAGNLNGWSTNNEAFKLTVNGLTATLEYTLTVSADPFVLQYKYVRGAWDTEEVLPFDEVISGTNRHITITSDVLTYQLEDSVSHWDDLGEPDVVEEKRDVEFTIKATLPEGFDGPLYFLSSFTSWDFEDEANLVEYSDGLFEATFNLEVANGDKLEYKFYSLSWENKQGNHSYTIWGEDNEFVHEVTITGFEEIITPFVPYDVNISFSVILPSNTPLEDDIYISGNFNEWAIEEEYKLTINNLVAAIEITLTITEEPYVLQYKFNRGTINSYEEVPFNPVIEDFNRHLTISSENDFEINTIVTKWQDLDEPISYRDIEFTVKATLPEGFDGPLYFLSNFTSWDFEDEDNLVTYSDGLFELTFYLNVTNGDVLEYKFYSLTWEDVLVNHEYIITGEDTELLHEIVISGFVEEEIVVEPFTVTVTFNVALPENTLEDDNIFLIGNFDEFGEYPSWIPLDSTLDDLIVLNRNGLTATITLQLLVDEVTTLQYKISRGTYESVEGDTFGNVITNRTLDLSADVIIDLEVLSWEDLGAPIIKREIQFTVKAILPEGFSGPLYFLSNFTSWDFEDEANLVEYSDGLFEATFNLEVATGEKLQYKFYSLSWEEYEGDHVFIIGDGNEFTDEFEIVRFEELIKEPFNVTITLAVNLTDDILETDTIYVLGNFNNWQASEDYLLVYDEVNNLLFVTFILEDVLEDDVLTYKYYRKSWDNVENNRTITIINANIYNITDDVVFLDEENVSKITLTVTLPTNTPLEDTIYLVGNFNNWNAADENYILDVVDGIGTITFNVYYTEETYELQYKFTRGAWSNVEGNDIGEYLDNRITIISEDTSINLEILSWEDLEIVKVFRDIELVINITLPEGFDGPLYLLSNFTNWDNTDESNLIEYDGTTTEIIFNLNVYTGQKLEYKFYSMSWENIQNNHEFIIRGHDLILTTSVTITGFQ